MDAGADESDVATSPTSGPQGDVLPTAAEPTNSDVEAAIATVLKDWRSLAFRTPFTESLINYILRTGRALLMSEPSLVQLEAPVNICGDTHGQIHDLSSIFQAGKMPPQARYLFLGDYVDRGKFGIEVFCILLGLKLLHPTHMYILRGNHEVGTINRHYGFFDECKRRYSVKLYKAFNDVFNCLPIAALVEGAVLCMHGGISPHLKRLDDIANVRRPFMPQDTGLVCDLLWADPTEIPGWQANERGVSYTFGPDVLRKCMAELDVDLVVRAHQVMEEGFGFFAERSLVTVFSASNYTGEFENCSAMLVMDQDMKCSFQVFDPTRRVAAFNRLQ